ncbi:MAG: DnaJ domain-containing protein [Planctomycetes bacterium]|nr:DnaJ domain-containing protein [Planctomycetota bacterium]
MGNLKFYLLVIFLIIYILSPFDFFPGFIDDIIAFCALWYQWRKRNIQKNQAGFSSHGPTEERKRSTPGVRSQVEEAYRLLDISPGASWEEVHKVYKEKVMKSHPDKVAHLGEELQEKAKEVTLKLNKAITIIRQHKKA